MAAMRAAPSDACNIELRGVEGEPMNPREDVWADAMRAERRGDAVAYERLLKEVAGLLRTLVRSRLGRLGLDAHETEDLVQEILIGLHTRRHTWDETRPFLPWLYAITRYKLIDTARRLRRETARRAEITLDELAEFFEAPTPATGTSVPDLDRHLAALPPAQQDVVRALAVDGASVRATAERMQRSEGSIRVLYHRALRRLMAKARPDQP